MNEEYNIPTPLRETNKIEICDTFRFQLKNMEADTREFYDLLQNLWNKEAYEQCKLALRHIEDARMRFGKVIQYLNDWISIYDKN